MLAGYPPFFDDNPFGIYEKILAGKIEWPRHLDPVAKDLIKKLLVQDRTKRLGNMKVSFILVVVRQLIYKICILHSFNMWLFYLL
jgi:serine/threonine protein kinase